MRPTLPESPAPELDKLMRQQWVRPVPSLDEWLAQLPPDDPDAEDPLPLIMRLRQELRQQETSK